MRNLDKVAEQLFNEIRGRYPSVTIGDAEGNVTSAPSLARFYEFDFKSQNTNLGKVSISLDETSGVTIMYNKDFTSEVGDAETKDWYGFLRHVRMFSKKRLLNFEVRDINKTNFTKRDYADMAATRGETQMAESRMYGTHKTSFQKFGNAKLSIKHTGAIGEGESRNKKIGSLFIENTSGEKFKYPFKHLSGARAMAIHVSEGGHPYDDFGKHITGLSEELSNLRKFKTYMGRSSVMAESLAEHMGTVNERIVAVKKRIQTLQKPTMYKEAFEEFVVIEDTQVPEDVQTDWIDQLTIKQFNEDLKDVFPYIYKLVSEAGTTQDLSFDDIMAEGWPFGSGDPLPAPAWLNPENKASWETIQPTTKSGAQFAARLARAQGFAKNYLLDDANREIGEALKAISEGMEEDAPTTSLRPQARPEVHATPALAQRAAEAELGSQPGQMKQQFEKGIDYKIVPAQGGFTYQLAPEVNIGAGSQSTTMPNGSVDGSTRGPAPMESNIDAAYDKLLGQFSDNFNAQVEGEEEAEASDPKAIIRQRTIELARKANVSMKKVNLDKVYKYIEQRKSLGKGPVNQQPEKIEKLIEYYQNMAFKSNPDYNDRVMDLIYDKVVEMVDEVAPMIHNTSAVDEIALASEEQKTPLGEFILSFYDREQGVFPKGETAILTMVEKDYGDRYIKPASKFIERLGQVFEKYQVAKISNVDRIQELAGLR